MPDQPTFIPAPILTVNFDTVVGAIPTEYDPETGSTDFVEVTLGERIVDAMAARELGRLNRELADIRSDALLRIREEVAQLRSTVMREEIAQIVRTALHEPIQQTDGYGRPKGEPTTMHELMREDVKAYLGEPERRNSYDEKKGGFRQILREDVDAALRKELRDEIEAARKQVAGLVQGKVAELMATAVQTGKV